MPLTDKQKEDWKRWNGEKEFKIGRQYHKSGWLEKKPERGFFGTKKRWFQLRHWVMYYFVDEQDGYNYPEWGPEYKHEEEDRSLLDKIPGLPDLSMPSLPSLPDLSMPDLSMPDLSMPDVSLSMPDVSLSAPSISMGSLPKRKERYDNGPYGRITLYTGATIKRDGKTITLENANQVRIFKGETEVKDGRKFVLIAEDEEEAESWYKSMVWGGAKEA